MSGTLNPKNPAAPAPPKILIRRSSKRVVVTAAMKERLRANAKMSKRSAFPRVARVVLASHKRTYQVQALDFAHENACR